jgi:hypothetical protein
MLLNQQVSLLLICLSSLLGEGCFRVGFFFLSPKRIIQGVSQCPGTLQCSWYLPPPHTHTHTLLQHTHLPPVQDSNQTHSSRPSRITLPRLKWGLILSRNQHFRFPSLIPTKSFSSLRSLQSSTTPSGASRSVSPLCAGDTFPRLIH